MRLVSQIAQLEQKIAETDAELKEAPRRAEAAFAEAGKLHEDNEKVWLFMRPVSSIQCALYLSVEPCHAYASPTDVSASWCISPTTQA
jgi:hypothetical protein